MNVYRVLLCSAFLLTFGVGEVSALGFKLQANVSGGMAAVDQDSSSGGTDVEFGSGYGGGFGANFLLDFGGSLTGPYVSYAASAPHESGPLDFTFRNTTFGAMVKQEWAIVMFQANVGYATGSVEMEVFGFTPRIDSEGVNVGVAAGLSLPIIPMILGLDIAPYVQYYRLWPEDNEENIRAAHYIQYGIMLQVGLGLGT